MKKYSSVSSGLQYVSVQWTFLWLFLNNKSNVPAPRYSLIGLDGVYSYPSSLLQWATKYALSLAGYNLNPGVCSRRSALIPETTAALALVPLIAIPPASGINTPCPTTQSVGLSDE